MTYSSKVFRISFRPTEGPFRPVIGSSVLKISNEPNLNESILAEKFSFKNLLKPNECFRNPCDYRASFSFWITIVEYISNDIIIGSDTCTSTSGGYSQIMHSLEKRGLMIEFISGVELCTSLHKNSRTELRRTFRPSAVRE